MSIRIPDFPNLDTINKIQSGEPLAPLVPLYHTIFDLAFTTDDTKKIGRGITSLQTAIVNKKIYRAQTRVPQWVYAIFDWMGWGAVGRAERELDHVIGTIFKKGLNNRTFKENIHEVLEPIAATYLQKYTNNSLFKAIGEMKHVNKVKAILQRKGLIPSTLGHYFHRKEPLDDASIANFKHALSQEIGESNDYIAEIALECSEAPGQKYNLLQLAIKTNNDRIILHLIHTIFPRCRFNALAKMLMPHANGEGNAIEMLAKRHKINISTPSIKCDGPEKPNIVVIETEDMHLIKLMAIYNHCSWYDQNNSERTFYSIHTQEKIIGPTPQNRDQFLAQIPHFEDFNNFHSIHF